MSLVSLSSLGAAREGHDTAVVALQADASKLVSASRDGAVRVWELPRGRSRYALDASSESVGPTRVQFARERLLSDGHLRGRAIVEHKFDDGG